MNPTSLSHLLLQLLLIGAQSLLFTQTSGVAARGLAILLVTLLLEGVFPNFVHLAGSLGSVPP